MMERIRRGEERGGPGWSEAMKWSYLAVRLTMSRTRAQTMMHRTTKELAESQERMRSAVQRMGEVMMMMMEVR